MRLIDADDLIKDRVENDPVRIAAMCVPIAYDLDKVMEQMEEVREEILLDTAYDNETVNHYLGYVDLLFEIVKSGIVQDS